MPYVTNVTPFQAMGTEHRFYNGHPYDCLFVKATFRIGQDGLLRPLVNQPAFVVNDVYEGSEETTALKQPSEIIPYKPSTDVIVVGSAKPPNNEPREQWLASLVVGNIDKTIKLTGPRNWKHKFLTGWELMPISACSAVTLSYGLAFGGASEVVKVEADAYWANPFGRGFFGRDPVDTNKEYPAPQILRIGDSDPRWGQELEPVGLSPMDGKQFARLQYAGTYDEKWKSDVAPNIPLDMKLDFWNTVPKDQVATPYLNGGEFVRTVGLFPTVDGSLAFTLPDYNVFTVPIIGETKDDGMPMHIDTVTIDLDTRHLTIRWATLYSQSKGFEEYEIVAMERPSKTPTTKGSS
jgi:hypothetical protein